MVGAGTTGLACALVLAERGIAVTVLERRLDALVPAGEKALKAAAAALEAGNNLDPGSEAAAAAYRKVRQLRNRYWATSERNVLLDEHTQKYLGALGVDVSALPNLEFIKFCGMPGGPSFSTELGRRSIVFEADGLHARRMIYQRNWRSLVPLSMLQRLLREATDKQPLIELRFDVAAAGIEQGDQVQLQLAGGDVLTSDYLIVADGGGRASVLEALGLERRVDHEEHCNFGVFASAPDISLFGRPTTSVFSYNALLDDGWIGVFCTGRTFSIAVNATLPDGGPAPTAFERLTALGVQGRFVEPPVSIRVEVASLDHCFAGDRVIFAGDAAMSGNPRFGLGVQFGLLWAQALSRALDEGLLDAGHEAALAGYAAEGVRIASERAQYELPWLDILDATVADEENFIDAAMSAAFFESVVDFDLTMTPEGNDRLIGLKAIMDFSAASSGPLEPLTQVFQQLGRAELSCLLRWTLCERGGRAQISADQPVIMRMGSETIAATQGQLSLERESEGWRFHLRDALINLVSIPQSAAEGANTSETVMAIAHLSMSVPDGFIDQMMARLPHRLPALGLLKNDGYVIRVGLRDGQEISWGPMQVRFSGNPLLRMELNHGDGRAVRMLLVMERGQMEPLTVTSFSRASGLSSARWLASLSRLTGGAFDGSIDTWAGMLGRQIRRIEFRLKDDGSALTTFGSGLGFSTYLSSRDVTSLQEQLLKAAVLARLMPQYQKGVLRMETTSVTR